MPCTYNMVLFVPVVESGVNVVSPPTTADGLHGQSRFCHHHDLEICRRISSLKAGAEPNHGIIVAVPIAPVVADLRRS